MANGRYAVSYDSTNRIADVRVYGADSALTTVRYTYDTGAVSGITYAAVPFGGQFDLSGAQYDDVSLMHCGNPCTTQECVNACRASHPAGAAAFDSLASCAQSYCASECQ